MISPSYMLQPALYDIEKKEGEQRIYSDPIDSQHARLVLFMGSSEGMNSTAAGDHKHK